MAGLEEVAKTWLADPAWQKVFKHTCDVFEDYISYALVTVGAISLSVRLLTTLGSGDLVCIIVGVRNATSENLGPYTRFGTSSLVSYAQTSDVCIRQVFSVFMEYVPYIMLIQTLLLIVVEKASLKMPKVAQKVERFYKNIVEESLFGKDPDAAEDMTDPKTSIEAISRQRQRNEICISLKRSSFIRKVYIAKNIIEILFVLSYVPPNLYFAITEEADEGQECRLPISPVSGYVDNDGEVAFICKAKKQRFMIIMLYVQSVFLVLHGSMSVGVLIWSCRYRAVTRLLKNIEQTKNARDEESSEIFSHSRNNDFLFLFDLLAHNCGLESTLRVLTHSDENFYKVCKPNLEDNCLELEEDKLKVTWFPADIELWTRDKGSHVKVPRSARAIELESYEVTIFPAETVNNTVTLKADDLAENRKYSTWFYDLLGGKTEYVITIAVVIGKSRMKGEKKVTTLVPYGPERPKNGILEKAGTNQIDLFWDPPKGSFTKYTLSIEKVDSRGLHKDSKDTSQVNILRLTSMLSEPPSSHDLPPLAVPTMRRIENLSNKLTSFTVLGLDPADSYKVELGTKTGDVDTRQTIMEEVMTKPEAVVGLHTSEETQSSCTFRWLKPEDQPCLKGFQIEILADSKSVDNFAVGNKKVSYTASKLQPATDYVVTVTSVAMWKSRKEESEPAEAKFTTLPEPLRNFRMDYTATSSVVVKWDTPSTSAQNLQNTEISLSIRCEEIDFSQTVTLTGDKTQYNFSRLPDPQGTGCQYTVTAQYSVQLNTKVQSELSEITAATIPHKPTALVVKDGGKRKISWTPSATEKVTKYKVRWRGSEEGAKGEEATVEEPSFKFSHDFRTGRMYKVNIYAVREFEDGSSIESRELHEKLIVPDHSGNLEVFEEEQK